MLIRQLRRERAWTQEQLAVVLGVNVRTVQRLERGATPSLETAQALAGVFGCEARAFLGGEPAAAGPARGDARAAAWRAEAACRSSGAAGAEAPGALAGGRYAAAYLLVGAALAAILILALLIAGPSARALAAPVVACAMSAVLIVGLAGRRRPSRAASL